MYVGDKNRIDVSSSQFERFISEGNLYVDKTAFVEHVLQDASTTLLFTRPRRMGKSLNINTLATFLDSKQSTRNLFRGLYIEQSPVFAKINKHPVIYLSFRELNAENYKTRFKRLLDRIRAKYLQGEMVSSSLHEYFNDKDNYDTSALLDLTCDLHDVLGIKPYIIIDEYDKPLMDNVGLEEFDKLKKWFTSVLGAALKDNPSLEKAVLTGVTRIAKENMFSDLNNLEVYDVLRKSIYDTDFSLTEDEVLELVQEEDLPGVKMWYNNMRVGDALLYNIYSVMSYLRSRELGLKGYWSLTGGTGLLSSLLTEPRIDIITKMLESKGHRHNTRLNHQLILNHLGDAALCEDMSFFTLAVQAGYLSFDADGADYKVFIPNEEVRQTWARILLDARYKGLDNQLLDVFANIHDTESFSMRLTDFVSMALSYNDFKSQDEWVYHVFFFGLIYSLGYDCKSNQETGMGRFDIRIKSSKFNAVIEFKTSKSSSVESLKKMAKVALKQIEEKEYFHDLLKDNLPIYKIGVACHGKKCLVITEI